MGYTTGEYGRQPTFEALEPRLLLNGSVIISEFMASNDSTILDGDGNSSDWIELHNPTGVPVSLAGWFLTDDPDDLSKWEFPANPGIDTTLSPGEHLLIFASGEDSVYPYVDPRGYLHADFKLNAGGEYLALVDNVELIVHEYAPEYPDQLEDVSYGVMYEHQGGVLVTTEQYFTSPTPDYANSPGVLGMVQDTRFSHDRGFHTDPIDVVITSDTPEAVIRYTLDGSEPTATTGEIYTAPIHVSQTTVLRAGAYKPGYFSTNVDTHTYIFLDDVLAQPTNPEGFPTTWNGIAANYQVDPDIVNHPNYSHEIIDDMQAIPTLSLVTTVEDMFGPSGIYANPRSRGDAWEKPASVEWINTDGTTLFQVDAGVQIVGGASRNPGNKKHSFRLVFKSQYGPSTLEYPIFNGESIGDFNTITLRAGFNDRWTNGSSTYLQDRWAAERQLAAGGIASHGTFVHLYVDGLYWGLYNPVERPDDAFAASYLGGEKEDYDAYNIEGLNAGNSTSWNQLRSLANNATVNYAAIEQMLDIPAFCDYLIINQYGGNWDWPQNNWWATYNRQGEGKWRFHSWDAEGCLRDVNGNRINQFGSALGDLYSKLRGVAEFKSVFADRVHRLLFNDGILSLSANVAWLDQAAAGIYEGIVGESARWGDGYSDSSSPRTRDGHWVPRINWLRNTYFPARSSLTSGSGSSVLQQYKNAGLYPNVVAPSFRVNASYQHGGMIDPRDSLRIIAPSGTVHYTLDGSDPATPGGTATVYDGTPLALSESTLVKTRVLIGEVWSALNEAVFYVDPPSADELVISELNYHPVDPTAAELAAQPPGDVDFTSRDFEFIELYNNSDHKVDLLGVHFSRGIAFEFGPDAISSLAPGQHAVLVSNTAAFEARYGTGLNVVGEYSLGLDSNGETINLSDPFGGVLSDFRYNDSGNWPGVADGKGATLEPVDPSGDYRDPDNWRSSVVYGGTPGAAAQEPVGVIVNEVLSHTDLPYVDSIEIYNTTGRTVDIGGWFLSDSWGWSWSPDDGDYKKFQIPLGTTIDADEYLFFDESDFGGVGPLDFALNGAHGDDVWFMKVDGAGNLTHFADHVDFGPAANGESFGRWPNALGDLNPMTEATFGSFNSGPRIGPVIISEVMYNPPDPDGPDGVDPDDLEFIELFNPTDDAINLAALANNPHGGGQYFADWRLRGGVNMEFDEGTTITAGSLLVVLSFDPNNPENADRVATFRSHYNIDTSVVLAGGYSGKLDNDGERIELQRPDSPPLLEPDYVPHLLEDQVRYDDTAPWPTLPDGSGDSIYRLHFEMFGDDADSWRTGSPTPGMALSFTTPPVLVTEISDVSEDEDHPGTYIDVSATFSDPDPGDTLTLVVTGNTNPGLVTANLVATDLTLSYTHDVNGTADITVRATDPAGVWVEDTFTVTIAPVNDRPIVTGPISDLVVNEDVSGMTIYMSNVFDDADFPVDTLEFSVSGNTNTGLVATDMVGEVLTLSYLAGQVGAADITVRATDQNGNGVWIEDSFTITVDPTSNDPSLDIILPHSAVEENLPAGTVVGVLGSVDPYPGATYVYTLVSGDGDDDNGAFTIEDDVLKTAGPFNFEAQSSYNIRIRSL